jgi:DNA-binding MarR family transcriptional regulator
MSKLSVDAGGVAPIERFFALSLIAANPGISQARLAQELVCDKSSMTRLLKKLSDHGLISRMTDLTDRRCFVLFPTETGFIELGLLRASISTLDRSIRTLAGDVEFGRICQALEVLASLCR